MIEYIKNILASNPFRIVLSNKKNGQFNKINIRKITIKDNECYQVECYTDKQVFHENLSNDKLFEKIVFFMDNFLQLNAYCDDYDYSIKVSKKGKILFNKQKSQNTVKISTEHNRKKEYILSEGSDIPPLVDLGIFTNDGRIVKAMYDKFKQINRFVELIDDVIGKEDLSELNIIDFGCGKSYLTFILYYYLVEIKKIDATITGLDLKADVIEKCNKLAKKYNYNKLSFELGDINGYKASNEIDMVISLHACDTATDYAIYNAITWDAKYCFFVPCCQHEINNQLKANTLPLITDYGISRERFATILTDNIRASLLESKGYNVQMLEFVDIEHSPKNILIRAIKANITVDKRNKAALKVEKFLNEYRINQTLYNLIK